MKTIISRLKKKYGKTEVNAILKFVQFLLFELLVYISQVISEVTGFVPDSCVVGMQLVPVAADRLTLN